MKCSAYTFCVGCRFNTGPGDFYKCPMHRFIKYIDLIVKMRLLCDAHEYLKLCKSHREFDVDTMEIYDV